MSTGSTAIPGTDDPEHPAVELIEITKEYPGVLANDRISLRMFISVDLPAPFSPRRQCTSPRRTASEMRSLASTPGKSFAI